MISSTTVSRVSSVHLASLGNRSLLLMRLPAARMVGALREVIVANRVVVISGETGCGKTTQVPQFALEREHGAVGNNTYHRIKATEPPVGDYAFRSDPMLQRSKYKKRTSPKTLGGCACGHRLTDPVSTRRRPSGGGGDCWQRQPPLPGKLAARLCCAAVDEAFGLERSLGGTTLVHGPGPPGAVKRP